MTSGLVKQNIKLGIVVSLISCVLFGLYPIFIRQAYAEGANVSFVLLFTTFMRASILAAFCFLTGNALFQKKENTKKVIGGSFWQAVSLVGIIGSLYYISGAIMLVIMFTNPIFLLGILACKGEKKFDAISVVPVLCALIGITFVVGLWSEYQLVDWRGIGLAFVAMVGTAIRLYLYGKQVGGRSPAVVGAETFSLTFLFLLPVLFVQTPSLPESLAGFLWALLSGLTLAIPTFGIFYGIALLGAFRWSLFANTQPIFSAIFAAVLVQDYLVFSQYIGMGIVITSLVTYQILSHRKEKRLAALKASIESGV